MSNFSYMGSRAYIEKLLRSSDIKPNSVIIDTITLNREAIDQVVEEVIHRDEIPTNVTVICPWIPEEVIASSAYGYVEWSASVVSRLSEKIPVKTVFTPKTAWEWTESFETMLDHSIMWVLEGASSFALTSTERLLRIIRECTNEQGQASSEYYVQPDLVALSTIAQKLSSVATKAVTIESVSENDLHLVIVEAGFDSTVADRIVASLAIGFSPLSAIDNGAMTYILRDVDSVLNSLQKIG